MVTRLVVACALVALLSSCGAGAEEPAGDASEQTSSGEGGGADEREAEAETEAEAEEVTVEPGPTCGALDVAAVADAFGVEAGQLERNEVEPGDTFEIPGGGKQRATNWSCSVRTKPTAGERQITMQLTVFGEDYTVKARDESFDESVGYLEDGSGTCEQSEPEGWGEHGRYRSCSTEKKETRTSFSIGQTSAQYDGLFGAVRVACGGATYPEGGDPVVVRAVDSLCTDALAALSR